MNFGGHNLVHNDDFRSVQLSNGLEREGRAWPSSDASGRRYSRSLPRVCAPLGMNSHSGTSLVEPQARP